MSKQANAETAKDTKDTLWQPLTTAFKSMLDERARLQQTAIDNMAEAIDTSHRIVKERFELGVNFTTTMQEQVLDSFQRTSDIFRAMTTR